MESKSNAFVSAAKADVRDDGSIIVHGFIYCLTIESVMYSRTNSSAVSQSEIIFRVNFSMLPSGLCMVTLLSAMLTSQPR